MPCDRHHKHCHKSDWRKDTPTAASTSEHLLALFENQEGSLKTCTVLGREFLQTSHTVVSLQIHTQCLGKRKFLWALKSACVPMAILINDFLVTTSYLSHSLRCPPMRITSGSRLARTHIFPVESGFHAAGEHLFPSRAITFWCEVTCTNPQLVRFRFTVLRIR